MTARFLILLSFFFISFQISYAQTEDASDTINTENSDTINVEDSSNMVGASETEETDTTDIGNTEEDTEKPNNFHQILKTKFIEGGAGFMGIVLLTLILGLALCIERILYLHAAGATNNEELLQSIQAALKNGGVEKAKEICRNSSGPVASIFLSGARKI